MPSTLCRYDAALVALYGESYRTAIFASGTYTTTPINPYSLVMQEVCDTQEVCDMHAHVNSNPYSLVRQELCHACAC